MTKDEIRTVYPIARDRLLEAFDILEKAVFDPKDLECEALLEYCEPWENIGVEVANGVRAICTIAEMAKLPLADTAPLTDLIDAGHANNPEGIRLARRCLIALDCRLPESAVTANQNLQTAAIMPACIQTDRIAQAIGLRASHPDWTDTRIADEVKIAPGSLSRNERYQKMKNAMVAPPPPRGRKDGNTGEIDAKDD